ncbi:hypothetical protein KKC_00240 [Listeria fleischmannii subsp. coloradonensis]|nr:hypothetical protein KKC_00240 [Listeria fleischmannii subsp. coloradonensis]
MKMFLFGYESLIFYWGTFILIYFILNLNWPEGNLYSHLFYFKFNN